MIRGEANFKRTDRVVFKKDLEIQVTRLTKELEARRLIGRLMSNICYNGSQNSSGIPAHYKNTMAELYAQWDNIGKEI